ncbi:MAG: hypothetical protein PHI55_07630 [Burkholderiaceae bacterium]|nr:hypothetical protein [Burkholderiaceae bacterium]
MSSKSLDVLIVEDTPAKKRRMFERLHASLDVFGDPDVVANTADAIKRLNEKIYDLMILDLFIPRDNISDPDEQNAIDLLLKIDSGIGLIKKPRHIVSISSSELIGDKTLEFYRSRPWGCLRYSESSDQCIEDLENIGRWIHNDVTGEVKNESCDVFILTALDDPEMQAVESELPDLGPYLPMDANQLVRYCDIESNGRILKVGLAFASRMGPVASAILGTKAIEHLKPSLIVMPGICGGIAKNALIGDVIAADPTWDWQSGKYVDAADVDFEFAPHQLHISTNMRNALLRVKKDALFWQTLASDALSQKVELPKLLTGPLATGASVIANERVTRQIKEKQNKNVVGVDMESYAVYAAAAAAGRHIEVISLKSVCDKANIEKNDEYQAYAAKISAKVTIHFLKQHGDSLVGRAATNIR